MIGVEALSALFVNVHRVSTDVPVDGIAAILEVVVVVVVVKGIVVSIAAVVAAVVVSAVPG